MGNIKSAFWCLMGLVGGCTGGQTGEITELGPCEQHLADVDFDQAPSTTLRSGAEQTQAWPKRHSARIVWDSTSESDVSVEATADPLSSSEVRGGPGCPSFLATPVLVVLDAADGSWAADLDGIAELRGDARTVMRVSVPVREMDAGLRSSLDPVTLGITETQLAEASLRITLDLEVDGSHGLLFIKPADLEMDEIALGSW